MSYEYEFREESLRLCREDGHGMQAALWSALNDKEHRMQRWVQLISIAPSGRLTRWKRWRERVGANTWTSQQSSAPSPSSLPGKESPALTDALGGDKKNREGSGKGAMARTGVPAVAVTARRVSIT